MLELVTRVAQVISIQGLSATPDVADIIIQLIINSGGVLIIFKEKEEKFRVKWCTVIDRVDTMLTAVFPPPTSPTSATPSLVPLLFMSVVVGGGQVADATVPAAPAASKIVHIDKPSEWQVNQLIELLNLINNNSRIKSK